MIPTNFDKLNLEPTNYRQNTVILNSKIYDMVIDFWLGKRLERMKFERLFSINLSNFMRCFLMARSVDKKSELDVKDELCSIET